MTNLRRWQWAIIGLLFGAAAGWAWSSIAADGGLFDPATIGPQQFERALAAKPLDGHPKVKDLVLHQNEGRYTLWMKLLEPDPNDRHSKNPRHFRYVPHRLNPTTPFLPTERSALTETVLWRVNPSAISRETSPANRNKSGAFPLWINGAAAGPDRVAQLLHLKDWKLQLGQGADPQTGAELALPLRKASYEMHVVLHPVQDKPIAVTDLGILFNGHELPPLEPVKEGSTASWKATLQQQDFTAEPLQVLKFSRKAEPMLVWEIRLIDPNYTIVDFLRYAQKQNTAISYQIAWWDTPLARYLISGVGGLVLFGLVVPTLMRWMVGPPTSDTDSDYDLSRFQSEPASQAVPSQSGDLELSSLEEQLEKSLEIQAVAVAENKPPEPPPQLIPEPLPPPPTDGDGGDPHDYQGEYYPVAKPGSRKEHGDE